MSAVRLVLAPLVLLFLAATAGVATAADGASKIVYECDPDLCVVDPVTGIGGKVTADGASYRDPSLSADGTRLAAARGLDVVVGSFGGNLTERWGGSQGLNDVALSPSGAAVAESHSYVANRYGCPLTGGCLELRDESGASYSVGADGSGGEKSFRGGGGVGFLGNGALLTSFYTLADDTHTVCVVADPLADGAECGVTILSAGRGLGDPAGSPDGKLIAATSADVSAPGQVQDPVVNLYDAATGALIRSLGKGGDPAFSPDSAAVAYRGVDGWIHLVATSGARDRKLVRGAAPTWAAAPAPKLGALPRTLKARRRAVRLPLRCVGETPCAGTIRLKKKGTTLARGHFRLAPGKRRAVALKTTRRGRAIIASAARQRVTAQVTVKQGKRLARKLTLKR